MNEVRDFSGLAETLIPNRKYSHFAVIVVSLLMLPGLAASQEPIDIESYDLESPELEAHAVMKTEFSSAGNIWGFGIFIRDSEEIGVQPSEVTQIADYRGDQNGVEIPAGGILNLTVLREIDLKSNYLKEHQLSNYYLSFASQISGQPILGVLDLTNEFRIFMSNQSLLTQPSINPETLKLEQPRTNWTDCGDLVCLSFDDKNVTQGHIDLAAQRMANHSHGAFLRFLSSDRAFLPDSSSSVIGPIDGELELDGTITSKNWGPGRWSASSAWMILNIDKSAMEQDGWTFSWLEAKSEFGYTRDGVEFKTNPIEHSFQECKEGAENGDEPCSMEWMYLSIEESLRNTDNVTVTILLGESPNVEINRELLSSSFLLGLMAIAVIIILWLSLRRVSDVVLVGLGLVLSLMWMQGSIGWLMLLGEKYGFTLISRSQFSNLLPILVLALGIDDSLHVLHRYKEERRLGRDPEKSANESLSKVGRAIMLTSFTTIVAFLANLTSDIVALRSFGIEAGLGVLAAFILTGIWMPLLRLDMDQMLDSKGFDINESDSTIHLIPKEWLASVTEGAHRNAIPIILIVLLISSAAVPKMLSLEGDFQIDDFLDEDSDFAVGVSLVNERFEDGEPGYILVEGDIANPSIIEAISQIRINMNSHGEGDPNQISRIPSGEVELIALDQILMYTQAAMLWNMTAFNEAGWDHTIEDGGTGCEATRVFALSVNNWAYIPSLEDKSCLLFLYGYILIHGVPASGGYPELPPSITAEYLQSNDEIDPERTWLTVDGESPEYIRTSLRFGITSPEKFALVEPALEQLHSDLVPLQNLSRTPLSERSPIDSGFENKSFPVTWAIPTGDPIVRFIAADSMQDQMQETLVLGLFLCTLTLWWGFRTSRKNSVERKEVLLGLVPIGIISGMSWILFGINMLPFAILFSGLMVFYWGLDGFIYAMLTTIPITAIIIWLYAIVEIFGYGLNMVTVSIAAISLGVGIDYVIHVIERFREERAKGLDYSDAIAVVGRSSGLALFGSAISDISGFLIIMQSKMGFFTTFGLFCAVMIGLALIASIMIAPSLLQFRKHWNKFNVEKIDLVI